MNNICVSFDSHPIYKIQLHINIFFEDCPKRQSTIYSTYSELVNPSVKMDDYYLDFTPDYHVLK